jgi:hypothetical protein
MSEEFKDSFSIFINKINETYPDNKYYKKYNDNLKKLNYTKLSDYICEHYRDKDVNTIIDIKKLINNENKDETVMIPGIYLYDFKDFKDYELILNVFKYALLNDFDIKIEKSDISMCNVEQNVKDKKENLDKEIDKNKSNKSSDQENMMDLILGMIDTTGLNEKLQNLTSSDLDKMSSQVNQILGNNASSQLISDMVHNIGSELKGKDMNDGKLSDNVKEIANKISDYYTNDKKIDEKQAESLYNNTKSFVDQFKNQDAFNAENINKMFKQYGINQNVTDSDIQTACKTFGLTPEQLANPNRKMKRKAQKIQKKRNIKSNPDEDTQDFIDDLIKKQEQIKK